MRTSLRIARDTLVGGGLGWAIAHLVAPRWLGSSPDLSWLEGAAALVLAAITAAWSVDRRIARPLDAMTQSLRQVIPGESLPPVPRGEGDETDLAAALERVRSGFQDRLARGIGERDRLLLVLEEMPVGLVELDGRGRIVFQNRVAREILGTDDRSIGRAPIEVIRSGELQETVDAALAEGVARSIDLTLVGPVRRQLSVHCFPVERGLIVIAEDVTHVRRLEKARSEMVANIGHELRTPLAAIRGYVETLEQSPDLPLEDRARFLAVIARNSKRLERLVLDLSRLSRLESNDLRPAPEPVDLRLVASSVLETLAPRTQAERLTVRNAIPADLPRVLADRDGLETVLLNLLDNAVRATPVAGQVTVGARAGQQQVEVWVDDTGPGIPRDLRERVFERFYRIDVGRSTGEGGAGLGLAIVKHTLLQYGGTISVEEAPGGGARFIFNLPRSLQNNKSLSHM